MKLLTGLIEEVELAIQQRSSARRFRKSCIVPELKGSDKSFQETKTFVLNGIYYTVTLNNDSALNFVKRIERLVKVFPALSKSKSVNNKISKKILAYAVKCSKTIYKFINQHLEYANQKYGKK